MSAVDYVEFACLSCGARLRVARSHVGQAACCPRCRGIVTVPDDVSAIPHAALVPPALPSGEGGGLKACPFCAEPIALQAIKCKHCGSMLNMGDAAFGSAAAAVRSITTPLLISAISNIVVGLLYLLTIIGAIVAIPMFILCAFEFSLYSKADQLPAQELASRARAIGIFEIIVGLFNLPTLVCGILALIHASKLEGR